ncbi:MAG: cytochrome c biogenesis protein CcdA, partial [Micrococcales bacterium]|nr:cytochrome c biogenesis protein CcdA [Micrococcales bacterium]
LDAGSFGRGALLATAYSLGLGLPFILVAAGFGFATKSVGWFKKHIRAINIFGAVLLIALGLLLVTGLWQVVIDWIVGVTSGYTPSL